MGRQVVELPKTPGLSDRGEAGLELGVATSQAGNFLQSAASFLGMCGRGSTPPEGGTS